MSLPSNFPPPPSITGNYPPLPEKPKPSFLAGFLSGCGTSMVITLLLVLMMFAAFAHRIKQRRQQLGRLPITTPATNRSSTTP